MTQPSLTTRLPMSAVTLLAGWFMSGRIQKMTEGKLRYEVDLAEKPQEEENNTQARRRKLIGAVHAFEIYALQRLGGGDRQYYSLRCVVPDPGVKGGIGDSGLSDFMPLGQPNGEA